MPKGRPGACSRGIELFVSAQLALMLSFASTKCAQVSNTKIEVKKDTFVRSRELKMSRPRGFNSRDRALHFHQLHSAI